MAVGFSRDMWYNYIADRSHPSVASAVVEIPEWDPDHVYAWKPANNYKGWKLIDRGEAGVDDADVILSALNSLANGGFLFIGSGTYNITKTITIPENLNFKIEGAGFRTELRGSANPLIQFPNSPTGKIQMSNLKIATTADNIGVKIEQAWTGAPKASVDIRNIWFRAVQSEGILLDIYGTRESSISECWFDTPSAGTATGINLRGDSNGGAMNLSINDCHIMNLKYGIKGYTSYALYCAGIRISDCTIIGTTYPIYIETVNDVTIINNMIDSNYNSVVLDGVRPIRLIGNRIHCSGDNAPVVLIKSTNDSIDQIIISGNNILSGATTPGDGIKVETSGNTIVNILVVGNQFYGANTSINFVETSGDINGVVIVGNFIRNATTGINIDGIGFPVIVGNRFASVTTPVSGTPAGNIAIMGNVGYDVHNIPTTQPSNPVVGSVYFDTATGTLYIYDGSSWVSK